MNAAPVNSACFKKLLGLTYCTAQVFLDEEQKKSFFFLARRGTAQSQSAEFQHRNKKACEVRAQKHTMQRSSEELPHW